TAQVSRRVDHLDAITDIMANLRSTLPTEIGGEPVTAEDLLDRRGQDRTDAVILAGDHVRVVVRPSGTEPKLKCYLEAFEPVASGAALPRARAAAEDALRACARFSARLG